MFRIIEVLYREKITPNSTVLAELFSNFNIRVNSSYVIHKTSVNHSDSFIKRDNIISSYFWEDKLR